MQDSSESSKDPALGDLVIPALAAAFTLYYFDSIWDLAWEARATGIVVGTALLALICMLVVRIARRLAAGHATLSFGHLIGPWPHGRQRIGIVVRQIIEIDRLGHFESEEDFLRIAVPVNLRIEILMSSRMRFAGEHFFD